VKYYYHSPDPHHARAAHPFFLRKLVPLSNKEWQKSSFSAPHLPVSGRRRSRASPLARLSVTVCLRLGNGKFFSLRRRLPPQPVTPGLVSTLLGASPLFSPFSPRLGCLPNACTPFSRTVVSLVTVETRLPDSIERRRPFSLACTQRLAMLISASPSGSCLSGPCRIGRQPSTGSSLAVVGLPFCLSLPPWSA